MKRFLYLFLVIFPMVLLGACSDDDDLPNVDFQLSISDASYIDGTIYVVQGDTLKIDSIKVVNLEEGKAAAITSAAYYWDMFYLGTNIVAPYGFEIVTSDATPIGSHRLLIEAPVLAVDKSLANAFLSYPVEVVGKVEDIPSGGQGKFIVSPKLK